MNERKRCTTRAKKTANKRRARGIYPAPAFGMVDLLGFVGMALGAFIGQALTKGMVEGIEKKSRFRLVD